MHVRLLDPDDHARTSASAHGASPRAGARRLCGLLRRPGRERRAVHAGRLDAHRRHRADRRRRLPHRRRVARRTSSSGAARTSARRRWSTRSAATQPCASWRRWRCPTRCSASGCASSSCVEAGATLTLDELVAHLRRAGRLEGVVAGAPRSCVDDLPRSSGGRSPRASSGPRCGTSLARADADIDKGDDMHTDRPAIHVERCWHGGAGRRPRRLPGCLVRFGDWPRLSEGRGRRVHRPRRRRGELVARLAGFDVVVAMRERTAFPRARARTLARPAAAGDDGAASTLPSTSPRPRSSASWSSGTGGILSHTSELTWALILAVARQIAVEVAAVRTGGWQQAVGTDLARPDARAARVRQHRLDGGADRPGVRHGRRRVERQPDRRPGRRARCRRGRAGRALRPVGRREHPPGALRSHPPPRRVPTNSA